MNKKRNKVDLRDAGLRIGAVFGSFFFKTEHLHYGYWDDSLEVNIDNLPLAQQIYSSFLLEHVPAEVKSILDVGCGVGENARLLLDKGFKVDCVSPSAYLTEKTREKVQDQSKIFECYFEQVETDKRYDLILFSESFQYINMEKAFEQCMRLLNTGGYILICDFFKVRPQSAQVRRAISGGYRIEAFFETVGRFPLEQLKDIDITRYTAPNYTLVDQILKTVVLPTVQTFKDAMQSNYRFTSRLCSFIGRLFFRKKLQKLHYKYLSGNRNAENFSLYKTYRLFLYRKVDIPKGQSPARPSTA